MSLMIIADGTKSVPRPLEFRWTCDNDHGLLERPTHVDTSGDYIVAASRLVELGWSSQFGRTLCPECRGRQVHGNTAWFSRGPGAFDL